MRKLRISALVTSISLFISQIAYAQQSTVALQRHIVDEAISTIEDYEACATIADDEIKYSFIELFEDATVSVYNDLLGLSNKQTLTAQEYSDLLGKGLRGKIAKISNVRKEKVWKENGRWKVRFSLDKNISYSDKCSIFFSSKEFYGNDYHLIVTLVYDDNVSKCKIEGVKGTIESQNRLPEKYFVFKSEDKLDKYLFYNGKEIPLNSHQQSIIPGELNMDLFRFIDPDMKMSSVVDECGNVSMKYHTRTTRVKFHYDMVLGDAFKTEGTSDRLKVEKNTLSSFGLDFGYVLPSKSVMKIGFFIGAGLSQSRLDLSYSNGDYAFTTSADVDGDSYTRHYQDLKLDQSIKLTDFTIPIYSDFNFNFNRYVNAFVDLGLKLHLNMNHKVDATDGSAYVYGIYPQYDNLRMDEHWGYNGYGNVSFSANNLDNTDLLDISKFTADAFASIGLRFNIPNTPLAIDLGVSYQMGLVDVIKANSNAVSLLNVAAPSHALVYNTIDDLTSTEHLRNLTESLSGVKRQAFMFNAGLIFKF